ncbi:helix-turn-helix domain-containing protein [Pontiellaceae bacterium B12227]|nr:helix-turn-helix domain-containing protein [Pontiellaceae bacterium B12227]
MKTQEVPPAILTAAASMLAPFFPGLSPAKLENSICFEPERTLDEVLRSRSEASSALHVSLPTVDRMLASGELQRVNVRGRVFIRKSQIDQIIRGKEVE